MRIKRKSYLLLLPIVVLLIAATWYGPYDTGDNPRNWRNDEIISFITSVVNNDVTRWQAGDTVTICQAGSDTCALYAYINPLSPTWVKARDINTRKKPIDQKLWDRFMNWLIPRQSSASYFDYDMSIFLFQEDLVPHGTATVEPLITGALSSHANWTCANCHQAVASIQSNKKYINSDPKKRFIAEK